MITDILSSPAVASQAALASAPHLYAHPAAMAAALHSRLGGLPMPTDFGSLQSLHHHHSLQQLQQQLQQQQQQLQHHDASSDDGDNMSDDDSAEGGKKYMFLWPMPLFLLPSHKQGILSHFIHNSTALFMLRRSSKFELSQLICARF
jgi:hypothetical protein